MTRDLNLNLLQARRSFLGRSACGLGATALGSLLADESVAAPAIPRQIAPKAKRVIFLYMAGGPSHLETFDYRPKLAELGGKTMPESFTKGQPIAQLQGKKLTCMAPQHPFQKYGESGIEMTNVFPQLATVAGISGATILGEGSVVSILDIHSLIRAAHVLTTALASG